MFKNHPSCFSSGIYFIFLLELCCNEMEVAADNFFHHYIYPNKIDDENF